MARYGKDHKDQTRQRILASSGRRFKNNGVAGSGVATLMADAGLTNGAFYAHFASKEDLLAAVIAGQLGEQREQRGAGPSGRDGVETLVRAYLSLTHLGAPGAGCPSAALLAEIARGGDDARQAYTDGVLGVIDVIASWLAPRDPASMRLKALSVFAGMVGTMQMARAISDPTLSAELLEQGVGNALSALGAADD